MSNKQQLWTEGVLIDFNVRFWSGQKKIKPSEIGVNEDRLPDVIAKLVLCPNKYVKSFACIRMKGYHAIERVSLSFPVGGARFVPARAIANVITELEKYKLEFDAMVESLLSEYRTLKARCVADYEAQLPRLADYFPTLDDLRTRFSFDWAFFEFHVPQWSQMNDKFIAEAVVRDEARFQYKQQLQRIVTDFSARAAREMRERFLDHLSKIVERVKSGKSIDARQTVGFELTLDRIEAINILDDETINKAIAEVKLELRHGGSYSKDDPAGMQRLAKVLDSAVAVVEDQEGAVKAAERFNRRIDLE